MNRSTIIAPNPWAATCYQLETAKAGIIGRRILAIEHAVARLAGGFLQPIDRIAVLDAVRLALADDCPQELKAAQDLPGLVRAITSSLMKAWGAGINLAEREASGTRFATMADVERAVLARLPASMRRPADLNLLALQRLSFAPQVLGSVRIVGRTEMSPVWRDFVIKLADAVPVVWDAGARDLPDWLGGKIKIETSERSHDSAKCFTCADGAHEVLEAVRWARDLISTGRATPDEIAICAAAPQAFDAQMGAAGGNAVLPLHFIHGRPAIESRDGQEAAALAHVLLSGLSLQRFRRLAALAQGPAFEKFPDDWKRVLPRDAPLKTVGRWEQMAGDVVEWPGGVSFAKTLLELVKFLDVGAANVREAGTRFLGTRAQILWDRALLEGPAEALLTTLASLAVKDEINGLTSVVWGPAAAIASYPRRFVRMIGLASGSWPRGLSEDPLLPGHVVNPRELNPLPVSDADRRDFATILGCSNGEVSATRSRRDSEGRLLGASPLWSVPSEQHLTKSRVPERASSHGDRWAARPEDFLTTAIGLASRTTWRDWHLAEVSAHDGRVRPNHPMILEALARPMSASTIKLLLTNPIGWLLGEVLSLSEPDPEDEPLELNGLAFGNLVHAVIETAVKALEADGGLALSGQARIYQACAEAAENVSRRFELEIPVPPARLWRLTVERARQMAREALLPNVLSPLPGQKSWAEVPFGKAGTDLAGLPWDPAAEVKIGSILITGKVDRFDLSDDGRTARVIDWKTGRVPKDGVPEMIGGGSEVQRPIYASAILQLTNAKSLDAGLAYLRDGAKWYPVADPQACLDLLTRRLEMMRATAADGLLLPGPTAGSDYDEYSFALPGDAKVRYIREKAPAVRAALGDAAAVWEDA
jgi:hypothetical protein